MQQFQSEPKNTQNKTQKIWELALDVLYQRLNMLHQAVKYIKNRVNIDHMQKCYENIINDFHNHGPKISNFRLQILIGGTRSWEGFSTGKDGKRRFDIIDSNHCDKINAEFHFNYVIIKENVEITRIPNCHQVLQKVQQNLLINSVLMEKILGTKQVKESISKYFDETKFYTVKYINFPKEYVEQSMKDVEKTKGIFFFNPNKLYGLSSYNGLKTFVNFQLFYDAADHFDFLENLPMMINKDQTKFEDLIPIYKLLLTLEHESCHNIPRYIRKNTDPLLISPEKNDQLRIDDKFQEAGHYYAQMAYLITAKVSPFCINANYKEEF